MIFSVYNEKVKKSPESFYKLYNVFAHGKLNKLLKSSIIVTDSISDFKRMDIELTDAYFMRAEFKLTDNYDNILDTVLYMWLHEDGVNRGLLFLLSDENNYIKIYNS